jgi:hypothetical protein
MVVAEQETGWDRGVDLEKVGWGGQGVTRDAWICSEMHQSALAD